MYLAASLPQFRSNNHFDLSPHMILQTVALFVFIYSKENTLSRFAYMNKVISFVGKYTFSIYMLQLCILTEVNRLPIMNGTISNALIRRCIRIVLVFIGSLIAAIIADNTIIKLIQCVCEKIGCFLKKVVSIK